MSLLTFALIGICLLLSLNVYVYLSKRHNYRTFLHMGFSAELQFPIANDATNPVMEGEVILHLDKSLPNDHSLLITELVISPCVRLTANIQKLYISANQTQQLRAGFRVPAAMLSKLCEKGVNVQITGQLRKNGLIKRRFTGSMLIPFRDALVSLTSAAQQKELTAVLPATV